MALFGLPSGRVSLLDADLSTISVYADRLVRVDAPTPYVFHTELESGKDTADVPFRLFHYNAGAFYKLRLPIVSNVVLLRREANSPQITGVLTIPGPEGSAYVTFHYNVLRVWELDPEILLSGGIGTLPLVPIARVTTDELPHLIERMDERIEAEAVNETQAAELWTATNILMGLRYNQDIKAQLLKGVRRMRESITYQEILNEGRAEGLAIGREEGREEGHIGEARRILLRQGAKQLGLPTAQDEKRVRQIESLTALEFLLDRVFDVETWVDLLRDTASEK